MQKDAKAGAGLAEMNGMASTEGSDAAYADPLISIVIPVFNRAHSIAPTLNSVRDQAFQDFECLVVDDGSADVETLEELVSTYDQRFRVVRKSNGGASAARNLGIELACGRYVALLDSDDQFLPDKLARQVDAVRGLGDAPFLCYTKLLVDRGIGKYWVKPPRGPASGERIDEYLMADAGWMQTSTMLLPAAFAKRVRFGERLPSSQDTDFAIRCANAGAAIVFVDEPLVIMDDRYDPSRVSKQRDYRPLLRWIESMRADGVISEKSYWAYRGWQGARVASYTSRVTALGIYGGALARGAFSPRVALTILAQIMLPQTLYQRIATRVVKLRGKRQDAK